MTVPAFFWIYQNWMALDFVPLLHVAEFSSRLDALSFARLQLVTSGLHNAISTKSENEWKLVCFNELGSEKLASEVFLPVVAEVFKTEPSWYQLGLCIAATRALFPDTPLFKHSSWRSSIRY